MIRVSDYILQRLAAEGIDTVFLVYGGAVSELVDALTRQDKIKYVVTQHEQAAVFAAEGYAKVSGKPGLAIVTSGPGGGNIVTGLQNTFYDSTPLIAITGQVTSQFINPPGSGLRQLGFQESPITEIVKPITKYADQVIEPICIQTMLDAAISSARGDRPGPVLLDIPIDVQKAEFKPTGPIEVWQPRPPKPQSTHDADHFLSDLASHDWTVYQRPAILVGGGARHASRIIDHFAQQWGIPVFRTWNAFDVMPDTSPVYAGTVGTYGGPGRNFGIQNCDLLLAIGCRFSGRITGGMPETFARGAKRYVVDIDAELLRPENQQCKAHVNIHSDAKHFAYLLTLRRPSRSFAPWLQKCREWVQRYDPVEALRLDPASEDVNHYLFMRRLSELMPPDAIVVYDTGGNAIMMGHCFRSKAGQRIFSSNGNTPMGFAMCGAMGAWFAAPKRPVVCIIGDGGFQLNIQELQTLVHYNIPVKVFIINNECLGNTKSYQRVNGMKEVACGPDGYSVPDFNKVAMAYGLPVTHVPGARYMDRIIESTLEMEGPVVCNVLGPDQCSYEPRISSFDVGIEDMHPFLDRAEFREQMLIDPLPGWESKR